MQPVLECLVSFLAMCSCTIGACQSEKSGLVLPLKVPLCEVLKHPEEYADRNLTVSARITAFIEGATIWDSGCRKLGARLQISNADRKTPSILALIENWERTVCRIIQSSHH